MCVGWSTPSIGYHLHQMAVWVQRREKARKIGNRNEFKKSRPSLNRNWESRFSRNFVHGYFYFTFFEFAWRYLHGQRQRRNSIFFTETSYQDLPTFYSRIGAKYFKNFQSCVGLCRDLYSSSLFTILFEQIKLFDFDVGWKWWQREKLFRY